MYPSILNEMKDLDYTMSEIKLESILKAGLRRLDKLGIIFSNVLIACYLFDNLFLLLPVLGPLGLNVFAFSFLTFLTFHLYKNK